MSESLKTIKEIADLIGVSKSTVYRYIKSNSIHESSHNGSTKLYDESAKNLILKGFNITTESNSESKRIDNDATNLLKDELINTLKNQVKIQIKQLNVKDNQIAELQKSNDQLQKLLLYEQQKNTKLLEENIDTKKWWQWWK